MRSSGLGQYCFCTSHLKGSLTRDFRLQVFFMNHFSRAPDYTVGVISSFYENSKVRLITDVNDTGDK
jgi:hypothetical protein